MSVASERASILASLAAERDSIQASIRGDTPGPQFIPRRATVDQYKGTATDPYIAALQMRYAKQMQAAQQGVQDAALAPGADFIYGSPKQSIARSKRGEMTRQAARDYNDALPLGSALPRKNTAFNPFYGA
jgi:hypothetical protein